MNKRDILFLVVSSPLIMLLLIISIHASSAAIYGITIADSNFTCGTRDYVCPSDYAGCGGCTDDETLGASQDDPDCCEANACGWACTDAGVVCGDSSNEDSKDETDSEGDSVDSGGEEDCNGSSCTTEEVIDDENNVACVDTYYNGTDTLGYDYTYNCADDGVLYHPYTYTSNLCQHDISCHDTEGDGDDEVCDMGNWHDPDESETYCDAVSGTWTTGTSTSDTFNDDYDGDLTNGYCDGDDGYYVTGAVVAETYRGSGYCEAAEGVTISIKDTTDTSIVYDSDATEYSSSWDTVLGCHEDTTTNDVGTYTVTLAPGEYYLVAEKEGYNTVTRSIDLSSMTGDETLDAYLVTMYLSADCQSDCTKNDRICYAECEGVNECTYSSYEGTSIAAYCDGLREGYRYVLSETTDEADNSIYGYEVYCCTGEPQSYERDYFSAEDVETSCVENIISRERAVVVNGELLTLHFVLFSDPKPEKADCEKYEDFRCDVYGDAFC